MTAWKLYLMAYSVKKCDQLLDLNCHTKYLAIYFDSLQNICLLYVQVCVV